MWNKDEIKGKGKQVSGAIKDKAGELIKDPKLEAEGEAERTAGKLQEKSGKARRKPVKRYKRSARRLPANFSVDDSCDGFARFLRFDNRANCKPRRGGLWYVDVAWLTRG